MEKDLLNKTMVKATKETGARLFRNNVGLGWVGKCKWKGTTVIIEHARPLRAGLVKGSGDLIGWTPVTITPEMVGKTIAVFTSLEGKTKTTRTSDEQLNFITQVLKANGIAGKFKTADQAMAILSQLSI